MKIVFHKKFHEVYTYDPASAEGRMMSITKALEGLYEFIEPLPANDEDILLVHSKPHLRYVSHDKRIYDMAILAAGAAIESAKLAFNGTPAFALIRPPGHHASPESCWGFCYFNNIAIAIKRLIADEKIKKAFIVDFDLHYGDGTANTFAGSRDVEYFHPKGYFRTDFIENIQKKLSTKDKYDILGVSAGFDRHEDDWGGMLTTEDYQTIGKMLKDFSLSNCNNRRFAVLEGGYNHNVLGINVRSFLEGFKE
ncbi:MAG: histone deacetylase [Thermodesulfovibrionales bacterium]|nr:histone deacetylase [Thermodesulfovibrionales bacterium]